MYEFKLPDIGEGLHEAELLEWDVQVGDSVNEGDSLAQISTDKVNVELPSPCAGVIAELPWKPGDIIPVGEVLARIDDGKARSSTPEAETRREHAATGPANQRGERRRIKAAPAVRRYAAEKGVDLTQVSPTGPGGAVTTADVDAAVGGGVQTGVSRVKLSGPRLAAARRLEQSWRTLATTAMAFEVDADAINAECERLEKADDSVRITPLAVIAAQVCATLARHPEFNAVIDEGARALDLHDAVHLGIAVDSEEGLLVPVIRDAGKMAPQELASAIAERAEQARAGKLGVEDYQGSTFTISSTGSLEEATIIATTPVINFPNVATLWVSRIRERPRVVDGQLEVGPMLNCTLAFDHRFLHGADATRFINDLDKMLRNPD
ncbi:MAG: dihydrolipoamide acetyltransferase family protein [Xanthomonadales bacterium]|nr:dihydrolipoamide acetyltransferase family protein [Xanthomonadales bacterium]